MAELDSLIDSMIQQRSTPQVSSINDKHVSEIDVRQTFSKGQGVFAKHFLSVNDPICSLSYPTVMAIESDALQRTCYKCLVPTAIGLPLPEYGCVSMELKTCSGCHVARFCCKVCQIKAWHAYHKYECTIFKKLRHNLPSAIFRAVLRVVLLKDREMLPSDEWSHIISLTSHQQEFAARVRSNVTDMADGIKYLALSSMSVEMIQRLIFIMKFNAIELPTPIYGSIGVMLDPLVAKINHSCEPNLSIHRPQQTMISDWMNSTQLSEDERKTFLQLMPLRDIREGEELLNSYVVPTMSVNVRKAKLKEDYFFECNCPRCLSDAQAVADLADQRPGLSTQFDRWAEEVTRHCLQIGHKSGALQRAAAAMDKSERYLEHPVLCSTGDFPQMALRLILEGLKGQAFDEALVNGLRLYFFVNPQRFVGPHNPTNIYTIFLLLDIFDALLGLSAPPGITEEKVEKWLRNLSARGLGRNGLIYWRHRICLDLQKRLESSAAKDLSVVAKKREEQALQLTVRDQDGEGEGTRISAEREMKSALRLKEQMWKTVLQENGC